MRLFYDRDRILIGGGGTDRGRPAAEVAVEPRTQRFPPGGGAEKVGELYGGGGHGLIQQSLQDGIAYRALGGGYAAQNHIVEIRLSPGPAGGCAYDLPDARTGRQGLRPAHPAEALQPRPEFRGRETGIHR